MRAFGIPLRTTETEIEVAEPQSPDVHIGRVFDHNWELLSPVAPMTILKGAVRRHFEKKFPDLVETNISRLATQWTDSINEAMTEVRKEAERRLDELVETVDHLIVSGRDEAPRIRADLQRIDSARNV